MYKEVCAHAKILNLIEISTLNHNRKSIYRLVDYRIREEIKKK